MTDARLRLFVASPVDETIRARLETWYTNRHDLQAAIPLRVKWVTPEHWHLTWQFLGDVPAVAVSKIQDQLIEALQGHPAPVLSGDTTLLWPNARRPAIIVWRFRENPEAMAVAQAIRAALSEYPADKPFDPHLTLARLKPDPKRKPGPFALEPAVWPSEGDWRVSTVQLMHSQLTPSGPIYSVLGETMLRP